MLGKYRYTTKLNADASTARMTVFTTAEFNVAIHIRTGDVKLPKGDVD
jgi:hypothetical protein